MLNRLDFWLRRAPGGPYWTLWNVWQGLHDGDPAQAGIVLGIIFEESAEGAWRAHENAPWARYSPLDFYLKYEPYYHPPESPRWLHVWQAYRERDWESVGICLYRLFNWSTAESERSHRARAWDRAYLTVQYFEPPHPSDGDRIPF